MEQQKNTNIHINGDLRRRGKRERNKKSIWRNNNRKFPNLMKDISSQIKEGQRTLRR